MKKELKILILEDLEEDAGLVDRILKKEKIIFDRLRVDTREEFTEALQTFVPDVILSDHALPQFNSIEALKICKAKGLNVPFILVTGAVSEEFAVQTLKNGADDYVLKSNLSRLPTAIRYSLRQHEYENTRIQQEETLRKKNDELTKINKEQDSFVYSISHNLRGPLFSVLGLVNVATSDLQNKNEGVKIYFDMIRESIQKLDLTLSQILDYSQNTRTELAISEINFKRIVDQSIDKLKSVKGFNDTEKKIEIQGDIPFFSDPHRLSIILCNVISNAIKYKDSTKNIPLVRITVTINATEATIIIHDNGIGIDADLLPNVYDMFYRATPMSDGAGLGLYVVREMIRRLNGTIQILSVLGKGTTAVISLPNLKE